MNIKSISSVLSICVCTGLLCPGTYAATIIDQTDGLASPDIVIDFGVDLYSSGTIIDDEFASSGVTFGPTYTYSNFSMALPPLNQGHIDNVNISSQPGNIYFSLDVTAAVFSWRTLSNTMTTFTAFNDGLFVETFTASTNTSFSGGRYYGFENILFDEIRLSIGDIETGFTLDNLEYISAVPVPAAAWLFGSGLLGLFGVARRNN